MPNSLIRRNRQLSRGTPRTNHASNPATAKKNKPEPPLAELPTPDPNGIVKTGAG